MASSPQSVEDRIPPPPLPPGQTARTAQFLWYRLVAAVFISTCCGSGSGGTFNATLYTYCCFVLKLLRLLLTIAKVRFTPISEHLDIVINIICQQQVFRYMHTTPCLGLDTFFLRFDVDLRSSIPATKPGPSGEVRTEHTQ